jgi:N-acetylglutamate synthase-like GNAT family acetyltransferase
MIIKTAKIFEIGEIKELFDSSKEMDSIEETFSEDYYKRIIKKGILLVATEKNKLVGACFGTYNIKEKWADLLGLVVEKKFRKRGIGTALIKKFEKIAKSKKLKTIDLYADKEAIELFDKLNYRKGRTYTAFRKKLK